MQLSEPELSLIADFGRNGTKTPTLEGIINEAFRLLQRIGGIRQLSVVFPTGPSSWREWKTSGKKSLLKSHRGRPRPPYKGITVFFDSEEKMSGYLSVPSSDAKSRLALAVIAPSLGTALFLHDALERVRTSTLTEAEIVRETLRARDEERRKISRELHDDLGQSMASLKLSLKWAEDLARKKKSPELVAELSDARDSVGVMFAKIRDLSHTLYPRILDTLGLFAAVKELAVQAVKHSSIDVTCVARGKSRPLPREVGVALYRCCQEAVNNTIRHSNATRLSIEIRYAAKEVRVTVEDNGKGFDPTSLYDSRRRIMSYGFWTIRQRMTDLNGAFRLSTAKNRGTVIEMIVPNGK